MRASIRSTIDHTASAAALGRRRESFQSEFTSACGGFTGVDVHARLRGEWYAPEVDDLTITRPEGLAVIAPVRKLCGVSRERDRAPGLGGAVTERDLREGRADGLPLRHLEVVPGDDRDDQQAQLGRLVAELGRDEADEDGRAL